MILLQVISYTYFTINTFKLTNYTNKNEYSILYCTPNNKSFLY